MKRFSRFNRRTAQRLRHQRVRQARVSLQLTLGIMTLSGALLALPLSLHLPGATASFIGVNFSPPQPPTQQGAAAPSIPTVPAPDTEFAIALCSDSPAMDESEHFLSIDTTELDAAGDIPSVFEVLDSPRISPRPSSKAQTASTPTAPTKQASSLLAATPITTPQPPYPESMRKRKLESDIRLHISLDTGGIPTAVEIQSDAHPDFCEHTRKWILQHWRFNPAKRGDTAIASGISTTIHYRLH